MADSAKGSGGARGGGPPPKMAPGEDHKARALARLAEIRENQFDGDDANYLDKFAIPKRFIPEGWTYEWKNYSVYGQENPQYLSSVFRTGWAPVPASRHPELIYIGYIGEAIIKDGMILVERPEEITREARDRDAAETRRVMQAKEAAIAGTKLEAGPQKLLTHNRHVGPVEIQDA
jgi:hypothetical protein